MPPVERLGLGGKHPHPCPLISADYPMTILNDLKADHRELKAPIGTILERADNKERAARFKQFRTLLTAHSRGEEKALFHRLGRRPCSVERTMKLAACGRNNIPRDG